MLVHTGDIQRAEAGGNLQKLYVRIRRRPNFQAIKDVSLELVKVVIDLEVAIFAGIWLVCDVQGVAALRFPQRQRQVLTVARDADVLDYVPAQQVFEVFSVVIGPPFGIQESVNRLIGEVELDAS